MSEVPPDEKDSLKPLPESGDEDDNFIVPMPPALLEVIPEDKREDAERIFTTFLLEMESYAGPIAHPRIIKGYEEILPGSAKRILKMSEDEQKHRHKMEMTDMDFRSTVVQRGQTYERYSLAAAFVIVLVLAVGAIHLIEIGRDAAGLGVIISALAVLAGAFVVTRRAEQKKADIESQDKLDNK